MEIFFLCDFGVDLPGFIRLAEPDMIILCQRGINAGQPRGEPLPVIRPFGDLDQNLDRNVSLHAQINKPEQLPGSVVVVAEVFQVVRHWSDGEQFFGCFAGIQNRDVDLFYAHMFVELEIRGTAPIGDGPCCSILAGFPPWCRCCGQTSQQESL